MTREGRWPGKLAARLVAGIAAIGTTIGVAADGAQAASCTPIDPKVETAFQVRALQTELMVAALSCQARGDYNAFVRKFSEPLAANGRTLRAYFHEAFSGDGSRRLDRYITRLANEASNKRIRLGGDYCGNARASFQQVLTMDAGELETYARERAGEWQRKALRCVETLEQTAGLE